MKKKLIIIISIIIIIFLGFIFLGSDSSLEEKVESKIKAFKDSNTLGKIEISNPTFKSKGLESDPYEISAKKGIQIDADIELYEVKGKFINQNNEEFFIEADKGFYSDKTKLIKLEGNILLADSLGTVTQANNALMDLNTKMIKLFDKVISTRNESKIESNFSLIDDENKTITYSGNVNVVIKNN